MMNKECTCGHITCVCYINDNHDALCNFKRATTCSIPVECEHGRDVCPICDACNCDDQHSIQNQSIKFNNTEQVANCYFTWEGSGCVVDGVRLVDGARIILTNQAENESDVHAAYDRAMKGI